LDEEEIREGPSKHFPSPKLHPTKFVKAFQSACIKKRKSASVQAVVSQSSVSLVLFLPPREIKKMAE
jgi:hypothetical protein